MYATRCFCIGNQRLHKPAVSRMRHDFVRHLRVPGWAATSRMMYNKSILLKSESSSPHSTQRKTNPQIKHPTGKSSRQKDFPLNNEATGKSSHTTTSPHENHLRRKESQGKNIIYEHQATRKATRRKRFPPNTHPGRQS